MNILLVTYGSVYPPNGGSAIRNFNLIKHISKEHSVLLLSLLYFPPVAGWESLKEYCQVVDFVEKRPRRIREHIAATVRGCLARRPLATHLFFWEELADKIRRIAETWRVDILQIEHSLLAPYVEAFPPGLPVKKVLSLHDVGFVQYRRYLQMRIGAAQRVLSLMKWAAFARRWAVRYAERFDHCVVVSPEEQALLRKTNPRLRVSLVENGVDTQLCQPLDEAPSGNLLLFVGSLMYPPNVDAVLFFCDSILPRIRRDVPDAKLLVVGHHAPSRVQKLAAREDVIVTGQVPDVRPYYQRAKLSVIPLRAGGGTRIKILEAMAYGRPVISTSLGCEGLDVVSGEHLLVADTPAAFSERVVEALKDKGLRERLSRTARALVESRYDWSTMAQRLLRMYADLNAESRPKAYR